MVRLLVTGASGLLGANLILEAANTHEVVGLYHSHPIKHESVRAIQADLNSQVSVKRLIDTVHPDWIINCAAATNIDLCEDKPEWAFHLNRDLPGWVAQEAQAFGARLVHISTDAVFDGEVGNYKESDDPSPINQYGRSKLAGESAVKSANPEALIVRTNIYGWNAQPKQSLAEFFLAKLENGEQCPGFKDVSITPILVNDLAAVILKILDEGFHGIHHVSGSECLSKYDFGRLVAEVFGLNKELVLPSSLAKADMKAPRSKKLCLDCSKTSQALQQPLPSVVEGLSRFKRLRENGFRTRLIQMSGGKNGRKRN
jgi:dTDP-4-dehydrorhamnose reductase